MKELLSVLYYTYSNYRGSGKIMALFFVSLLLLYLVNHRIKNAKEDEIDNVLDEHKLPLLFLYVKGGVSYAFTFVIDGIRKSCRVIEEKTEMNLKQKKLLKLLTIAAALWLSALAIFLSGTRVLSKDNFLRAENTLHMDSEYAAVIDRVLADIDEYEEDKNQALLPDNYVITAPMSISPYISCYTSRLNPVYSSVKNYDLNSLQREQRAIYDQFLSSIPDMSLIASNSEKLGSKYLLLDTGKYYPEFKPDVFGYLLVDTVGEWEIYRISETKEEGL